MGGGWLHYNIMLLLKHREIRPLRSFCYRLPVPYYFVHKTISVKKDFLCCSYFILTMGYKLLNYFSSLDLKKSVRNIIQHGHKKLSVRRTKKKQGETMYWSEADNKYNKILFYFKIITKK